MKLQPGLIELDSSTARVDCPIRWNCASVQCFAHGGWLPTFRREPMRWLRGSFALLLTAGMITLTSAIASSHREAPITALDHKADITDVYAFVSYGPSQSSSRGSKVTMILAVDPLLEPGNGPNWFPFDPDILYEIRVD